ncbi:MAG: nuclear transport factor 2 family protein [Pseudomonadales bacterium]|jgi:ketosteroid isomerase-like protein|nr:nuclear transport factor 2 family protein [Pseudomonadales bacterium]
MTDRALKLAETLFDALERGDRDRVRDLYAADIVVWHNFDGIEQDRDANLKVLDWMISTLEGIRYEILRREPLADGFLQQHVLHGRMPDGRTLAIPACIVARVRDGQITRIDEYLDPSPLA